MRQLHHQKKAAMDNIALVYKKVLVWMKKQETVAVKCHLLSVIWQLRYYYKLDGQQFGKHRLELSQIEIMGGKPWSHFTSYQPDINSALQNLKEQEFRAGRYGFDYWVSETTETMRSVTKPTADDLIREYGSVQEAMNAVFEQSEEGTQSILDMNCIAVQPGICVASPLTEEELQSIFQTNQPSHEMVEAILLNETAIENWEPWESFWDSIGRGEGRYIVVYEANQPRELFFAGYSFD